ncbi:MAG: AMP-binding protein [Beijerinckiaceae bacterium]
MTTQAAGRVTGQVAGMDREAHDPFAQYSLAALISATARLRPDSLALQDRAQSLPYGVLAAQVAAVARLLSDCGLRPGERILLTGGAEISLVVALIAALRGGYEPVLAPLDLDPADLASYARALDVAALVGPSHYGELCPAETCLTIAASVATIRLVASCGPEVFDGAVDLSPAACLRYASEHPDTGLETAGFAPAMPRVITLDRRGGLEPVFHQQVTLIAAALDFAARAGIGRETPILCTLAPTSFAGLVAGPFAAALSGAALHLHGPFDARDFLKTRDRLVHPHVQPHLVVPVGMANELLQADCMAGLASVILVSRASVREPVRLPERLNAPCALVDLYAIDEAAVIAEDRCDGVAQPPARQPHYIGVDETRVVAIEALAASGAGFAVRGAAVTSAG